MSLMGLRISSVSWMKFDELDELKHKVDELDELKDEIDKLDELDEIMVKLDEFMSWIS